MPRVGSGVVRAFGHGRSSCSRSSRSGPGAPACTCARAGRAPASSPSSADQRGARLVAAAPDRLLVDPDQDARRYRRPSPGSAPRWPAGRRPSGWRIGRRGGRACVRCGRPSHGACDLYPSARGARGLQMCVESRPPICRLEGARSRQGSGRDLAQRLLEHPPAGSRRRRSRWRSSIITAGTAWMPCAWKCRSRRAHLVGVARPRRASRGRAPPSSPASAAARPALRVGPGSRPR